MRLAHLKLGTGNNEDFTDVPLWTAQLNIPLRGHKALVKKGQRVRAYQTVAEHPDPLIGDMHAPAAGVVNNVTCLCIGIARDPEDHQAELPEGLDLARTPDNELQGRLKRLGIDLGPLLAPGKVMLINGMSPEPPMAWNSLLFSDFDDVLEDGLDLLARLRPETTFILVGEKNRKKAPMKLADLDAVHLPPYYPNNLAPLVIREVSRRKKIDPATVCCLPVQQLYDLGTVAVYGLPLTETILSVQMRSRVVNLGTPLGELLTDQEIPLGPGDLVLNGGPFSGRAVASLQEGVGKHDTGVYMIRYRTFAPYAKHPCVNCGHCVNICPVALRPDLMTKHLEKGDNSSAAAEGLARCLDCGLCAYICVARRPMAQWLKTAKIELGIDPNLKLTAWDPDTQTVSGAFGPRPHGLLNVFGLGGKRG